MDELPDWLDDLDELSGEQVLDLVEELSAEQFYAIPDDKWDQLMGKIDNAVARAKLATRREGKPTPLLGTWHHEGDTTSPVEIPLTRDGVIGELLGSVDGDLGRLTQEDLDAHGLTFDEVADARDRARNARPPETSEGSQPDAG